MGQVERGLMGKNVVNGCELLLVDPYLRLIKPRKRDEVDESRTDMAQRRPGSWVKVKVKAHELVVIKALSRTRIAASRRLGWIL